MIGSLVALVGRTILRFPGAEPPSDSVGSLAALMEHARKGVQAPSPRAIRSARLWPSWSTTEGESEHRAPERTVSSLTALMEHAGRGILAPSPRSIGRLACSPHGACLGIGDFYSIFERIVRRM